MDVNGNVFECENYIWLLMSEDIVYENGFDMKYVIDEL